MRYIRALAPVFLILLMCGNVLAMELLVNGGFETGDLSGWIATSVEVKSAAYLDVSPSEGAYMAVLSPLGWLDAQLSQSFSPLDFSTMTISFDYALKAFDPDPESGPDKFSVHLDVLLGDISLLALVVDASPGSPEVVDWTSVSRTLPWPFPVPTDQLKIAFSVENYPDLSEFPYAPQFLTAFVDNVSIEATPAPVPEPGTILLLGSGLLGLGGYSLRKRRTA